MSNLNINGVDYTIKYIDTSAVGTGDGSTPANALTSLPLNSSILTDTVYLIRRSSTVTVSAYSTSTVANVFFIGMPLSTDDLYERVPEEAKTAWDADSQTHATISYSQRIYYFRFTTCSNFGVYRINFTRTATAAAAGSTSSNLAVYGGNQQGNLFAAECIFEDATNNFSNVAYGNAIITDVGFTFYMHDFLDVTFKNNKCVASTIYNSYLGTALYYIGNTKNILCQNNIFWLSSSISSLVYVQKTFEVANTCEVSTFKTNIIKYYGYNSVAQYYPRVFMVYSKSFIFDDCKFELDREILTPTSGGFYNCINCVSTYHLPYHYANSIKIIKNILADFSNANVSLMEEVIYTSFADYQDTVGVNLHGNNAESTIENIEIRAIPTSTAANACRIHAPGQVVKNVTIEFQSTSNTLGSCHALAVRSASYVQATHIIGKLYISNTGFCDVNLLEYTHASNSDHILKVANSMVRVKVLNLHPSFSSNVVLTDTIADGFTGGGNASYGNASRIIIDNCNKNLSSTVLNPAKITRSFGIWGNNLNGINGNWTATNHYYNAITWGIERGTGATIKCSGSVSDVRMPMSIAPGTLKGIQVVPNSNSGTVNIYIAFKNYSNMNLYGSRIKVEVEANVIGGIVIAKRKVTTTSDVDGYFETDAISPWTEPGVTAKIIKVPFKTDYPTDPLDIRILFDWFDPFGYTYIDIIPVIT
jgi:hypothetical protein